MSDVLRLESVSLTFGAVRALDDISLGVTPGQVLALVGDNGAGKSSLVKVMTGYARPTRGRLTVSGRQVASWTPRKARAAGIGVVYQDLALVDDISLWRNLFLGNELRRGWGPLQILDRREMQEECRRSLEDIGLAGRVSINTRAEVLSGGERQALAISRANRFGRVVLILDEPVAALALRETRRVFDSIERAKGQGLGIVFVDHNLANVHTIADRIAVVEAGRIKAMMAKDDITLNELMKLVEVERPKSSVLD